MKSVERTRCNSTLMENTLSVIARGSRDQGTLRDVAHPAPPHPFHHLPTRYRLRCRRRWLQTAHKPLVIISSKSVAGSTGTILVISGAICASRSRFRGNRTLRKESGTTRGSRMRGRMMVLVYRISQKWSADCSVAELDSSVS